MVFSIKHLNIEISAIIFAMILFIFVLPTSTVSGIEFPEPEYKKNISEVYDEILQDFENQNSIRIALNNFISTELPLSSIPPELSIIESERQAILFKECGPILKQASGKFLNYSKDETRDLFYAYGICADNSLGDNPFTIENIGLATAIALGIGGFYYYLSHRSNKRKKQND